MLFHLCNTININDVITQTEAKFRAHNKTEVNFTAGAKEQRKIDYPLTAFEQLFRNAIMHRAYIGTNAPVKIYWFNDRIEITNPGGPYGVVTVENFGQPGFTDYRNPNLAGALKDLGYVQKFGAGVSIARKALAENGNAELKIEASQNLVTVTLGKH